LRYDDEANEHGATGEVPVVSPVDPRVTIVGADIAAEAVGAEPLEESILPHWTEAPTGQVPAVLSREAVSAEDDPWASIPAPAWREGEADWVAHDEQFDASVLSGETVDDDVRPWEFEPEAPVADEEILAETPRPAPTRPHRTRRPVSANPLQGRAARAQSQKNVSLATFTGFVIAAVVLVLFKIGTVAVAVLICVALVAAALEAYAAFRKVGVHPATLLGLVATLALAVSAYNKGESAFGLVTVLLVFFSVLWFLGAESKVDILDGIGATVFIFVWIGVIGSYAALLISPVNYPHKHGLVFLLGAIIVVVANDVGALFIGRAFGRRPLARTISPGKTVEGAIGGAISSILVAIAILPLMHPWGPGLKDAFIVGVAIAIVTPIGDLFESMVKRTLGVKDMGDLLPGHGGMLDRVDGLLFALPTTYYLVHVLHLG
jgi:phosphatidate cytidylyltransferase